MNLRDLPILEGDVVIVDDIFPDLTYVFNILSQYRNLITIIYIIHSHHERSRINADYTIITNELMMKTWFLYTTMPVNIRKEITKLIKIECYKGYEKLVIAQSGSKKVLLIYKAENIKPKLNIRILEY